MPEPLLHQNRTGFHIKRKPLFSGKVIFLRNRLCQLISADIGATFGMAGNANMGDTIFLDKAGFQHLHGAIKFANRIIHPAANNQHFADISLTSHTL